MLVLSRRAGEAVVIGEDVRVVVLEVRGDLVRLGIEAPRLLAVHREEIFEQIREENRQAARTAQTVDHLLGALTTSTPKMTTPQGRNPGPKSDSHHHL